MGNNSSKWKYDVFLSFRPEDTADHHFFTTNLLAALDEKDIKTFHHRHQPRVGQEIPREVAQGIRESNVAVVIFTKKYAASSSCLDELVEIIECSRTLGQIVFPIFLDVDPSEVRKQTGNFGKALAEHARNSRTTSDKIRKWKAALEKAAGFTGWDLQANG